MPKNIEQSYAGGFVHRITPPVVSRYDPHTRILEGTHYLLEKRQVSVFRTLINSVMQNAVARVEEAIEDKQMSDDLKAKSTTISEILITTARVHDILGNGDKLACEGSSIVFVDGDDDGNLLRPVITNPAHTVLGKYVAPLYEIYAATTPEALAQYRAGDSSARCEYRYGGVLLHQDATIFDTVSGQSIQEYGKVVVPLNEKGIQIYLATEI